MKRLQYVPIIFSLSKALFLSTDIIASGSLLMSSRPPMEELVEVVNLTHPLPRVGYTTKIFLFLQCCGTVIINCGSGFGKVSVSVPAPFPVPDPENI
jgi:hypothetical protein